MAHLFYPIKKAENGRVYCSGVLFGNSSYLDIIKESGEYLLLHRKGCTTYVPRRMIYSPPQLYLIRKLEKADNGYQETEKIKDMDYNRQTKKQVYAEMIALFDKLSGTLNKEIG
jgi:hypothetical protein